MADNKLGHWGRLAAGQLPPKTVRDKLDVLGLAMGWGNGLGVLARYLGQPDWEKVQHHLITRRTGRMALDWGLGERKAGRNEPGSEPGCQPPTEN